MVAAGKVESIGSSAITSHGVCWSTTEEPRTGSDSTSCIDLGPRTAIGVFELDLGVIDAADVRIRVFAGSAAGLALGSVESFDATVTEPLVVDASDGREVGRVTVSWSPIEDAAFYRVLRDGELIGTVNGPPFVDNAPSNGGLPLAPSPVAEGTIVYVSVSWPTPAIEPGTRHRYAVVAIGGSDATEGSGTDTGYAAGWPATRFEISVDGGAYEQVVRNEYFDTEAPPPYLDEFTTIDVRMGRDTIALDCGDPVINVAPERRYRVRAVNPAGTGPASETVYGRRAYGEPGTRFYRRDRSTPEGGDVIEIGRSGDGNFIDTDPVPDGGIADYECRIWLPGGDVSYSGYRPAWTIECESDRECGPGNACTAGRCAPEGLAAIPPAYFPLSWRYGDVFQDRDEDPREAFLTRGYYIGIHEVTQGEWARTMGFNPSIFGACGERCPIENISWFSALAYLNQRSRDDGLEPCYALPESCTGDAAMGTLSCPEGPSVTSASGSVYDCEGWRLPTEAEWVLAARLTSGNHDHTGLFGAEDELDCEGTMPEPLARRAFLCLNSSVDYEGCLPSRDDGLPCAGPHPVGSLEPNYFGLFDIIGNIDEMLWDWFAYYPEERFLLDYEGPAVPAEERIAHGASWYDRPYDARVADRHGHDPHEQTNRDGLRMVRTRPEYLP